MPKTAIVYRCKLCNETFTREVMDDEWDYATSTFLKWLAAQELTDEVLPFSRVIHKCSEHTIGLAEIVGMERH